MLKSVQYPEHTRKGITPTVKDFPLPRNLRIFGSDTETCYGHAISLQIASEDEVYFTYTEPKLIFDEFCGWIFPRCRPGGVNLCYFHHLNFDARVLLNLFWSQIYEQGGTVAFEADYRGGIILVKMLFGKVNKIDLKFGGTRLQVLDSKAFTQASLDRSLRMFQVPAEKLKSPEGLGKINYGTLSSTDPLRIAFEEYSRQDATAERLLGVKIMEFHEMYKVSPSISLPSYASKVFRRHFLRMGERLPFPPLPVVRAAELSYHGGKNGFYLDKPMVVEDVYEVDINSAYPYAMRELPPITTGQYNRVEGFVPGAAGVYCLSGQRLHKGGANHKYPLVFDHSFKPIKPGQAFSELWHTAYETERILAVPYNIRIDKVWGYVWRPKDGADNPFRRFVDHFYGKKESTPKSDPYYHFYKIVLNALYGKLVSTVEIVSQQSEDEMKKLRELGVDIPEYLRIDQRFDKVLKKYVSLTKLWRAGSMYNPFLASMITGHTRAYLYDLECKLKALHAATDSVKSRTYHEAVKGLGGLKVECFGRCYLFRNKLYLHFSKSDEYCGHKTPPFKYPAKMPDGTPHPKAGQPLVDEDGQHLCKVALHGYKGPLWMLFEGRHDLLHTGKMDYSYLHVVGLREGLRRGQTPCNFIEVPETLKIFEPYEPEHLISFIIKRGGFSMMRETSLIGELRRLSYKETRVRGLVNKEKGETCDMMRAACVEAGFVNPDISLSDFMEEVERGARGEKIYGYNEQYQAFDEIYPEPDELNKDASPDEVPF